MLSPGANALTSTSLDPKLTLWISRSGRPARTPISRSATRHVQHRHREIRRNTQFEHTAQPIAHEGGGGNAARDVAGSYDISALVRARHSFPTGSVVRQVRVGASTLVAAGLVESVSMAPGVPRRRSDRTPRRFIPGSRVHRSIAVVITTISKRAPRLHQRTRSAESTQS